MRLRGIDFRRPFALLLERSEEGERVRSRCGSLAAVALLLAGLLVAVGYGRVVAVVVAAGAAAAALVAAALVLHDQDAWHRAKAGARRACRDAWAAARVRDRAADLRRRSAWVLAVARPVSMRVRSPIASQHRSGRSFAEWARVVERTIGRAAVQASAAGPGAPAGERRRRELTREAVRHSALGLQLRRAGEPAQAVEQHRVAARLFARAGSRRDEALAASNLGLALADVGDHQAALAQFERARALLCEVGDEEREGKVIANIAATKLRAGAADEAGELLRAALDKLEPESPERRLVERQLRQPS